MSTPKRAPAKARGNTNAELLELIEQIEAIDIERKMLLSNRNALIGQCTEMGRSPQITRKIVERRRKDRVGVLLADQLLREFEAELGMEGDI